MKLRKPINKYLISKICGNEIEFVFTEEDEPDYISQFWNVSFVKTPKGRRKHIAQMVEDFDINKKLERITFSFINRVTTIEKNTIKKVLIELGSLGMSAINLLKLHGVDGFVVDFVSEDIK